MNVKRPRRLDFNAPLLSTRRPSTTTTTSSVEISRSNSLSGSCFRVPFSWEQSPGKPKDTWIRDESEVNALPLPKPPPARWLQESMFDFDVSNVDVDINDIDEFENEDEDEDEEDDSFSDAIDLFSLADSLTLSDKGICNNEDLESQVSVTKYETTSPNFMIQKFLPAATALAASSLSTQEINGDKKKHVISIYPRNKTHDRSCVPRRSGPQTYTSARGCGLEMLFPWPWRAKHKLCGVKSPVRNAHSSSKSHFSSK